MEIGEECEMGRIVRTNRSPSVQSKKLDLISSDPASKFKDIA